MSEKRCILFTAFEPSGDEHAAVVIRRLREALPDVPVYAYGGLRMREAGARVLEVTTGGATMGLSSLGRVREMLGLRRRFRSWLEENPVAVHVPTDSPAANWWFCKAVKRLCPGSRVVHFVAPQLWAWGEWRVRRLKRWSDLVLCVLPFEEGWFRERGVEARFVGHPMFEGQESLDTGGQAASATQPLSETRAASATQADASTEHEQDAHATIALLPGSRPGEVDANWPLMSEVFRRLRERLGSLEGVVAALDEGTESRLREMTGSWPEGVRVETGNLGAVVERSDVVLAASGTVTLHVARYGKPMVTLYKVGMWEWNLVGRWVLRTRTFSLPNLVAAGGPTGDASRHIVKEFVPFTGGVKDVGPIVEELASLLEDKEKARRQVEALRSVVKQFEGHDAGREAAEAIARLVSGSS